MNTEGKVIGEANQKREFCFSEHISILGNSVI